MPYPDDISKLFLPNAGSSTLDDQKFSTGMTWETGEKKTRLKFFSKRGLANAARVSRSPLTDADGNGNKPNRTASFPGSSAVEHSTVNRQVAGSNPARGAIFKACAERRPFSFLHLFPNRCPSRNPSFTFRCYHAASRLILTFATLFLRPGIRVHELFLMDCSGGYRHGQVLRARRHNAPIEQRWAVLRLRNDRTRMD